MPVPITICLTSSHSSSGSLKERRTNMCLFFSLDSSAMFGNAAWSRAGQRFSSELNVRWRIISGDYILNMLCSSGIRENLSSDRNKLNHECDQMNSDIYLDKISWHGD